MIQGIQYLLREGINHSTIQEFLVAGGVSREDAAILIQYVMEQEEDRIIKEVENIFYSIRSNIERVQKLIKSG